MPRRQHDAFGKLSLGSYDRIALELAGNPLGLESDELVFEKSANSRTAAVLANISGTSLCLVDVAGAFGRDLAAQGETAMVDVRRRLARRPLWRRGEEGGQALARHALEQ